MMDSKKYPGAITKDNLIHCNNKNTEKISTLDIFLLFLLSNCLYIYYLVLYIFSVPLRWDIFYWQHRNR